MPHDVLIAAPALWKADRAALADAVRQLEHVSLAARLTNLLGKQIELAGGLIPRPARVIARKATTVALRVALRTVLKRMDPRQRPASPKISKILAAGSGAIGGALGFSALPMELPASTLVMLSAIADNRRIPMAAPK